MTEQTTTETQTVETSDATKVDKNVESIRDYANDFTPYWDQEKVAQQYTDRNVSIPDVKIYISHEIMDRETEAIAFKSDVTDVTTITDAKSQDTNSDPDSV